MRLRYRRVCFTFRLAYLCVSEGMVALEAGVLVVVRHLRRCLVQRTKHAEQLRPVHLAQRSRTDALNLCVKKKTKTERRSG